MAESEKPSQSSEEVSYGNNRESFWHQKPVINQLETDVAYLVF